MMIARTIEGFSLYGLFSGENRSTQTYSLADLEREQQTTWDGVRSPQAIRQMRPGDLVLIYHSMFQYPQADRHSVSAGPLAPWKLY